MKTIKIIDLLIADANGKPIEKFKFKGDVFNYNENATALEELYYYENLEWLSRENIKLNDEVEIIEEDKKIEKFTDTYVLYDGTENEIKLVGILSEQRKKINELIDMVNELKGEKND